MKPSAVVVDTEWQRQARHERRVRTDALLAESGEERARWDTAKAMLSWYFAMAPHMGAPAGIDYARDAVQGAAVDRDERIAWMARARWSLEELQRQQGHARGLLLLWLHFRQPRVVGTRVEADGRRVDVYGEPGVAIRELHLHDGAPVGRNATAEEFWVALAVIEDLALTRGWVRERVARERRGGGVQAWRRESQEVGIRQS